MSCSGGERARFYWWGLVGLGLFFLAQGTVKLLSAGLFLLVCVFLVLGLRRGFH